MSARPLVFLGRHSLLLYIWHYPVFTFLARHTEDWGWFPRTVVALLLTVAISLLAHRMVERRATELLRHPRWAETNDGFAPFVRTRAVDAVRSARRTR